MKEIEYFLTTYRTCVCVAVHLLCVGARAGAAAAGRGRVGAGARLVQKASAAGHSACVVRPC
jgi:hypothetical protein